MNNPASLNPVSLWQLPPALIEAAVRVCLELHNDGPEAVAAMVDDLRHWPADSWDWLTDHFRRQLPPLPATPADPAIACGNCLHSITTGHPAILQCAAGVPSGLAIAVHWHTDRHDCSEFTDRQTGVARQMVIKTRDTTPTPTRDPFNPFD